jgi:ribonuclease BN (tRNA processing enzyme)
VDVTLLGTGCPPPNPRRRGPATLLAHGGERFLAGAPPRHFAGRTVVGEDVLAL